MSACKHSEKIVLIDMMVALSAIKARTHLCSFVDDGDVIESAPGHSQSKGTVIQVDPFLSFLVGRAGKSVPKLLAQQHQL